MYMVGPPPPPRYRVGATGARAWRRCRERKVMTNLIQHYTTEIKALLGRTAQNIVLIGEKLQAVKAQLEHGQWEKWLREEFDWSQSTAVRMIQVSERFKPVNMTDLRIDISSLYVLAAPSTPPAAAEEAITLAQQGEAISPIKAKAIVNKHRGVQTLDAYKAVPLVLIPDTPPV